MCSFVELIEGWMTSEAEVQFEANEGDRSVKRTRLHTTAYMGELYVVREIMSNV